MIRATRHTAPRLLLALYLAGFAAMEMGHVHHHAAPGIETTVSAHDCGPNERHLPPGKFPACPACAVGQLRTALLPEVPDAPPPPELKESLPGDLPPRLVRPVSSARGERAPPRAAS